MKRILFVLCFCLVGIVSANQAEYPPITPENVTNLHEVELLGTGAINNTVAWSPDGKIVVGGTRGLYIYDDLQAEPQFIELGINLKWLLFAGETLFFSDDTILYAYDLANPQILYSLEGQRPLAISESGTMLAYEVDLGVNILEIATGELLYSLDYTELGVEEATNEVDGHYQEYRFYYAQFFANDSEIVVNWMFNYQSAHEGFSDNETIFWKLDDLTWMDIEDYRGRGGNTGFMGMDSEAQPIMQNELDLDDACLELYSYDFEVRSLVSGHLLAVACEYWNEDTGHWANYTGIWNWQTGENLAAIPKYGTMQLNADLGQIAIAAEIFDIATGQSLSDFQTERYGFFGENILYYGLDDSLRLLDLDTLEEIAVLPMRRSELLGFVPTYYDSSLLLKNLSESLVIRVSDTGEEIIRYEAEEGAFRGLHLSPDLRYLFSQEFMHEAPTRLWNANTGEEIHFPGSYWLLSPYDYRNGQLLIWESELSEILLYDEANQEVLLSIPAESRNTEAVPAPPPQRILRSRDGFFLAFGNNRHIQVWNLVSGEMLADLELDWMTFDFSPSGRYFAYPADLNTIVVLDLVENREIQRISHGGKHDAVVELVSFVNDELVHLGDRQHQSIANYNIFTGEIVVFTPNPPRPWYESENLRFFYDGQIRFESMDGQTLFNAELPFDIRFAKFSHDFSRLYIIYMDDTLGIWAVPD